MLQKTTPEEGALQSIRTTLVLVSKAPLSVNPSCEHNPRTTPSSASISLGLVSVGSKEYMQ